MQPQIESYHRMNDNLNFNVISNAQQTFQTLGYGLPQGGLQPNFQYVCNSGFQFQNNVQGMDFCLPNQQLIPAAGQTYACINQNGMTYLAITPSVQQPSTQCYQAIETPQGLQLFQVINNPVNFGQLCVQSIPQPQGFLPQFTPFPQEAVGLHSSPPETSGNHTSPSSVHEYQQNNPIQDSNTTNEQNLYQDYECEQTDEDTPQEPSSLEECQDSEMNKNLTRGEDPLSALTSLTSSISSPMTNIPNSNMIDMYKNIQNPMVPHISMPSLGTQMGAHEAPTLSDQQFPPNTRTFQVLVPTPQGMAIQTVVASYPESFSPIVNEIPVVRNAPFLNSEPDLTTNSVSLPAPNPSIKSIVPDTSQANQETAPIVPPNRLVNDTVVVSAPATPALQVKSVTSPSHCTNANNQEMCSGSESTATSPVPKATPSVPGPMPSPHYLPDSTEDLCQTTIKQFTSNVVDGIDLEEIREFARTFKMRRLVLGLTQTQVGQALCATEGPAYSQSAICRFEKLDITPRSALKIRPVLENWLREAEKKHQQGNLQQLAGLDYINISSIGKIRKRRTFFSPEALVVLNCRFEQSSHPSGREISNIAQEIGYERDVVRVWFCNKRQSLKHCQSFQRTRVNLKSSDLIGSDSRSTSPIPQ
ncbi:POU domain, class 6, transcription factor 2-like [Daphnia carinata]|uniref:POU domain, class 6, transcription factor 2-like n=1 Tax=Daphnia carinata TaxID=120202 RepID=UPI00257DAB1B|nr:POU domain, class 6, transcription factor 2-like [Daphnia carinata]